MATKKEKQAIAAAEKFLKDYKEVSDKTSKIEIGKTGLTEWYAQRYDMLKEFCINQQVAFKNVVGELNEEGE